MKSEGDWNFERSSGYAGFRCTKCATWIYEHGEYKCKCDEDSLEELIILGLSSNDNLIEMAMRYYETMEPSQVRDLLYLLAKRLDRAGV